MEKEESKKISKDINKIEENIHSFRKELPMQWSEPDKSVLRNLTGEKGVHDVHKALTVAKEEESRLTFKLHKAERKEGVMEKRKRNQDSTTHSD